MIKTRQELKEALAVEARLYKLTGRHGFFKRAARSDNFYIFRWQKALRKFEYYWNRGVLSKAIAFFYCRRKNRLGHNQGIYISKNCTGIGLHILHSGNIVVNPKTKIGKNACFYGANCVGVKNEGGGAATIGDNVTFGVGSSVLGEVTIADNCVIAAGAVVIDSFLEEGSVIAGVPAKRIK